MNLNEIPENNLKTAYDHTLLDINDVLLDGGKSLTDYEGFVLPESDNRNEAFSELSAVLRTVGARFSAKKETRILWHYIEFGTK